MFVLVARNRLRSVAVFTGLILMLAAVGALSAGVFDLEHTIKGALMGLALGAALGAWAYFVSSHVLLSTMGAVPADAGSEPVLFNVVAEMMLASGLEVRPSLCIIETMDRNACATGRSPACASIVVTRGLIDALTRDELQAVVAHEMAHIVHRDILFMTLVMATTQAIDIISALYGWPKKGEDSKSEGGPWFYVLRVIIYLFGGTLARMMALLASRTREYMADASSVVYTRNPAALASALTKLGATSSAASATLAPAMDAVATVARNMTSTHPPLLARVAILERLAGAQHASYADYAAAYSSVTQRPPSFIPRSLRTAS